MTTQAVDQIKIDVGKALHQRFDARLCSLDRIWSTSVRKLAGYHALDAHAHSVDPKGLQEIQKVVVESVWCALDCDLTVPVSFWKCGIEGGEKLAEVMLS
ncbi:hypothetical protein GCM10007857_78690 [Bradyrhizobium iriomotense]|uniref:Uncharacterized protein n=1 Tax=Bradyrhizobium iriomotense TaxID=441950 RepID=A0ABQ6BAR3_9BRAD|nr:hypothetical protein GCM10007857_78690 [Bradyrhizobium iriomotense]